MDYAYAKVIQFAVWLKMIQFALWLKIRKTSRDQQRPRQRPPKPLFTWQMEGIRYTCDVRAG